ncbi:MAG: hypothetical protein KC731_21345 [Myxococcales bacterium]|nr:hypothetical protein [Myxococcales bacterium]
MLTRPIPARRAALLVTALAGASLLAAACSDEPPSVAEHHAGVPTKGVAQEEVARVELPARADGEVLLEDRRSSMALRFQLLGATSREGEDSAGQRVYRGAAPGGGDIALRRRRGGVEDYVRLPARPSEPIRYRVDVREAAGLRQAGRGFELLDAAGVPRLRVLAPYVRDADGAVHALTATLEGCAVDRDPRPPWGRAVVAPGADHCEVVLAIPESVTAYPAVLDPAWLSAAQMDGNRYDHRVTFLDATHPECGEGPFFVVTGGFRLDNDQARRSIEIYHPATDSWCEGPDLRTARARHSATMVDTTGFMTNEVVGGPRLVMVGGQAVATSSSSLIATYETLDLVTWTWVGSPGWFYVGRAEHTAVATQDGMGEPRLVLVGGTTNFGIAGANQAINPDAFLGLFIDVPDLLHKRTGQTMTALEDSEPRAQLVVGGCPYDDGSGMGGGGGGPGGGDDCTPWEIYCPFQDCGEDGGDEIPSLLFHGVAASPSAVHVAGGLDAALEPVAGVYRFDRQTRIWSSRPALPTPRYGHSLTVLADDSLLVAGGQDTSGTTLGETWRLLPASAAWFDAGQLAIARNTHAAVLLPSGAAMVIGGKGDSDGDTERYVPCDVQGDCAAGQYCNPDTAGCARLEANGTACDDATSCASGLCVEGFCCNAACEDPCDSCAVAGAEGFCARRSLDADAPPECLPIDMCLDDVTVVYADGAEQGCGDYRCRAGACLTVCTASVDCAPERVCDDRGVCVTPPPSSGGDWVCSMAATPAKPLGFGWLALGLLALRSRRACRRRG